MALIKRYRISWENFTGQPGVSTHYFSDTTTDFTPLRTFYNACKDIFPNGLRFKFPTTTDILNDVNGEIQSTVNATTLADVSSIASAASHSATSGCIVQWRTSDYVDGVHVVGRTYFVPLASASYSTTGTISTTTQTLIQGAGLTLAGAMQMVVWTRPRKANAVAGITARDGSSHPVSNVLVPSTAAVMRSRRS